MDKCLYPIDSACVIYYNDSRKQERKRFTMNAFLRRALAALLVLMTVLTFAACGDSESGTPYTPPAGDGGSSPSADAESGTLQAFETSATLDEVILVQDFGVTVTAKGITYDDGYATLDIQVVNDSDTVRAVECGQISINGLMVDGSETWYLSPGDGSTISIYCCYFDELICSGVFQIAVIDMNVTVFEENSESFALLGQQVCHMETSAAANYVYDDSAYLKTVSSEAAQQAYGYHVVYQVTDAVSLMDSVCVLSQTLTEDEDGLPVLLLEAANTGTETVRIGAYDLAINSIHIDGSGSFEGGGELRPGTKRILKVYSSEAAGLKETFGFAQVATLDVTAFVQDHSNDAIIAEYPLSYLIPGRDTAVNTDGTVLYEENGLQVTFKKVYAPDYGGMYIDYYLYFAVSNSSDQALCIDCDFDQMFINGTPVDHYCYGLSLEPGQTGVVITSFPPVNSEGETFLSDPSQISSAQVGLLVCDTEYSPIDSISLSLTF